MEVGKNVVVELLEVPERGTSHLLVGPESHSTCMGVPYRLGSELNHVL